MTVNADASLTPEEEKRLQESLEEYRKGKSVPLEEFEKPHSLKLGRGYRLST